MSTHSASKSRRTALAGRTAAQSFTLLSEVMMPIHANHYGFVHGGAILRLVDEAAFVAATRHSRKNVVVASMDHIEFRHPVNVGDVLTLAARIGHVGRSSMDVTVFIQAEKIKEGRKETIGSALLTMVALDEKGRPTPVPPLLLQTSRERQESLRLRVKRHKRLAQLRRSF